MGGGQKRSKDLAVSSRLRRIKARGRDRSEAREMKMEKENRLVKGRNFPQPHMGNANPPTNQFPNEDGAKVKPSPLLRPIPARQESRAH